MCKGGGNISKESLFGIAERSAC